MFCEIYSNYKIQILDCHFFCFCTGNCFTYINFIASNYQLNIKRRHIKRNAFVRDTCTSSGQVCNQTKTSYTMEEEQEEVISDPQVDV